MNKCIEKNCREYSLSLSDFCWKHIDDKKAYRDKLGDYIKTSNIPLLVMGLLCGYGEKPDRVIASSLSLMFLYSALYGVLGVLQVPQELAHRGLTFWDYIYFSIITFTTVGFGDLTPKMIPFTRCWWARRRLQVFL